MTKDMTGASEVERDLRTMKTVPQELTERTMVDIMRDELGAPKIVDRATFQAELDALRVRETAHTREGSCPPAAPHGRGGRRHSAHWRTWGGDTIGRI